jgi:hypothetical protein
VGLEWGPLSLVSITEDLLEKKVAALGIVTLTTWHLQTFALTSPTSGGRYSSLADSGHRVSIPVTGRGSL